MEYSPASSPFCKQPVTVVVLPADFSCPDALGVTYAPSANTNSSNADNRPSFCMFNLLVDEWAQSQIPGFIAELQQEQMDGRIAPPVTGVSSSMRFFFAKIGADECYRDISPTDCTPAV